jgi:polyhydroxybutyrate depolymerase
MKNTLALKGICLGLVFFGVISACADSEPAPAEDVLMTDAGGHDVQDDVVAAPDTGPIFLADPPKQLGGERASDYFVPSGYQDSESWPLLILLHGYSASGWLQDGYFGTSALVDEKGFFLLTPDGTRNSGGTTFWNGTGVCCDFEGSGVDDVGYLIGLIDELSLYYNIHPGRVYLLGHSNGGYMSYRLACEAGDRITALASLAGVTYGNPEKCTGTDPVSVLQIHGTEDGTVGYEGIGPQPGALETAQMWAAHNGCSGEGEAQESLDLEEFVAGSETDVLNWNNCADGSSVELWSVVGGSHVPAFRETFTPMVLDYLFSKVKE